MADREGGKGLLAGPAEGRWRSHEHAGAATKKFPGNPTRSYRSLEPLRIVGEVADWFSLAPEGASGMARLAGGDPLRGARRDHRLIEELQN